MELFPSVPEDLEAVSTGELQDLLDEHKRIGAELAADIKRPTEDRVLISAEMTPTDITDALATAATDVQRIREELDTKAEAEANFVSAVDEGLAALGVEQEASAEDMSAETEEPAPDEPSEPAPDEPAPDEPALVGAEALAAEVTEPEEVVPAKRMAIPTGPSRFEAAPVANAAKGTVVASDGLGVLRVREGTPLSREDYGSKVIELAKRMGPVKHVAGGSEAKFGVAKINFPFPEEFTLNERDTVGNLEKIRASAWQTGIGMPTELEVFMASGGICAPPTPFYDVPGFASRARPVRDALPSYNAMRGGVSVPSVNTVDRADEGVTVIEIDEDEQGGTFATKACRVVECATWTDTFIGIISHCLEVGNLNARTWPEGVALENDNLMAGWASTAETRLLNRIKALSINGTTAHVYNAVHDFIYGILRVKASIRYNLRADLGATYTALIPEYVIELFQSDLAAQGANEERYAAQSAVEGYLSRYGVNVVWVKDDPTGTTSFAAESAGAVDDFPDTVQYALFLNGTFLHLDGGSLELGLVRDSTLNETNDYQLFGESFENVARIGPTQAARWITATVCPTGQFPDFASALTC